MEKISQVQGASSIDKAISLEQNTKKRLAKSVMTNAGAFIGAFLVLVVIIVVTTDIKITDFKHLASLGLDFFLLIFCSYSMYITYADSGKRTALGSDIYAKALENYDKHKHGIVERNRGHLHDFCRHFIEQEIYNTKANILAEEDISYEDYREKYMHLNAEEIKAIDDLSIGEKHIIIHANSVKPIKLTPAMLLHCGKGVVRRSPLGIRPEAKKGIKFSTKFLSTFLTSAMLSMIAFDIIVKPVWTVVASCIIRLLLIALNAFSGYKFGYENIVVDTVDYINDQSDLLIQAEQYFSKEKEA